MSSVKLRDFVLGETIMDIVERSVNKIAATKDPDERDIARLEKITKIYAVLMASTRESIKTGLFGKIDAKDLAALEESEDADGEANEDRDDAD